MGSLNKVFLFLFGPVARADKTLSYTFICMSSYIADVVAIESWCLYHLSTLISIERRVFFCFFFFCFLYNFYYRRNATMYTNHRGRIYIYIYVYRPICIKIFTLAPTHARLNFLFIYYSSHFLFSFFHSSIKEWFAYLFIFFSILPLCRKFSSFADRNVATAQQKGSRLAYYIRVASSSSRTC